MSINRRTFLTTSALSATAAIFSAQAKDHQQASEPANKQTGDLIKIKEPRVITRLLKDTGTFPNSRLPVVIYQGALALPKNDPATAIEVLLRTHQWGNDWRNGVFTYHHYHSTAHEALFVYSGSAKVQLGGESGVIETITTGDVIIIPAGIAHKNVGSSNDFHVIGAYPPGQQVDMNYGKPGERPRTDENIASLALPTIDPIFGKSGPLLEQWRRQG